MRRILILLATLAVLARPAAGQDVRGTVRDSASGVPVRGAVILVQDSAGETLARNLSGERGQFVVPRPSAARRVQVLRLGFRPRVLPLSPSALATVPLDVVLASLPTLLQGVEVTGNVNCSPRRDRNAAMALLNQARAGLLGLAVAREANPARVTRMAYTRELDAVGSRIVHQSVRVDSAAGQTVSFEAARSASEFVRDGFRRITGDEQTLYAPDADILLDETFARNYCFHLAADDPARRSEAGLAFAPANRRRGRVDIEGALWIDTVTRTLVNIEFRYRGVEEQAERLGAGGHIGFREVPNGVTMIDRWWLRLVGGDAPLRDAPARDVPARDRARTRHAFTVIEKGGELARAQWADGSSWTAALGSLQLTLTRADGSVAPGVGLGLADTDYRAVSDSLGRVRFADLVPGPYHVVVADPVLASLGVLIPTRVHYQARRANTGLLRLVVPTAEAFVADECDGAQRTRKSAWIVARMLSADGTPVHDASWRVRKLTRNGWSTVDNEGSEASIELISDCMSFEQGDQVEIRASRPGGPETRVVRALRDALTVIPVTLPAPVASRAARGATSGTVSLSGTVTDSSTGAAIPDARVALGGTLLESVTDSAGRFLLGGLPRGEHSLEVSSPWLDSIGSVKRVKVTALEDSDSLALHLPSVPELAIATCGSADVSGVLVGRVGVRAGELPHPVRVTAEWADPGDAGGGGAGEARVRWLSARTGAHGTFRLCGVPAGVPLTVTAEAEARMTEGAAPLVRAVDPARRFARADLLFDRGVRGGAVFIGMVVVDSSRLPVPDAEVLIPGIGLRTATDERGAFRLRDVPAGTHLVTIRAAGHAPYTARMEFVQNRTLEQRITLRPAPPHDEVLR